MSILKTFRMTILTSTEKGWKISEILEFESDFSFDEVQKQIAGTNDLVIGAEWNGDQVCVRNRRKQFFKIELREVAIYTDGQWLYPRTPEQENFMELNTSIFIYSTRIPSTVLGQCVYASICWDDLVALPRGFLQ